MVETAVSKIPEVGFKIPTGHVERVTKNVFSGDELSLHVNTLK